MEELQDYMTDLTLNFGGPVNLLSVKFPASRSSKMTSIVNTNRDGSIKMGIPVRPDRTFGKNWPNAAASFEIEPMASELLTDDPYWVFMNRQRSFLQDAELPTVRKR